MASEIGGGAYLLPGVAAPFLHAKECTGYIINCLLYTSDAADE